MHSFLRSLVLLCLVCTVTLSFSQRKRNQASAPASSGVQAEALSALTFRNVGPALTSGRISDFAVNPEDHAEYYVAVASGGVWKTTNSGTTYEPIFDGQGSYSIGCITLDPNNLQVVWVGTGENNGQRSVAYGDGVYKSIDGGATWKNMGLKESEHIGMIVVDPRDSDVIYVAAQGPLWSAGGDRGLYKSTDGGETWNAILQVSEHTGISEVHMDPRNPDVLYATAWQRRRHVWTFISGGPESAIYKSTDAGETWEKSQQGLPKGDLGRIGMDISPVNPDVLYAVVEASEGEGTYRSTNRGASWHKQSSYATSGNYYQEIFASPHDVDRVFFMNTFAGVSDDAGKTVRVLGEKSKHVDNHAMWFDPNDPDHYLMGCDGGIYETWDDAENWHFKPNLPVTQFYKVVVDNAEPFYNIYGGTQDNFSLGGPSANASASGIPNSDWFITNGGDGFESAVDPENPDIVYAQSQYGVLVRYDKKSGEQISIQPQPDKEGPALRWNWDAPLLVSPHSPTRLYFAANKLFRSDNRGDSWTAVSPDLSRQLDRNTLPVMGQVWGMDAVAKNVSTTIYGNIVALDESPLVEGLLYVGTDDGLIQVSEDGGANWRELRTESMPGISERVYVNMLLASRHDANVVYAALNNHKNGDFKPYVFKSTDRGRTWTAIQNNLPERGSVYSLAEDHEEARLLFAGTEFGVFTSVNGGGEWLQMKSGLPTIAIRDIAIQEEENDLVLASFGRGFYVLDDYTPLRVLARHPDVLEEPAEVFPVADALLYVPKTPIGGRGKVFQGESYYIAENPAFGATFTWHLKESIQTIKDQRQEKEKELREEGKAVPYPSFDEMRAEDDEAEPYVLLTITDADGNAVDRIREPAKKGMHRTTWNLRYPPTSPVMLKRDEPTLPWQLEDDGPFVLPGTYYVSLGTVVDGEYTELAAKVPFEVNTLDNTTLPAEDRAALVAFLKDVEELGRSVYGAVRVQRDLSNRMDFLKTAIRETPSAPVEMMQQVREAEKKLNEIRRKLNGDYSLARRQFETMPSITDRVGSITYGMWYSTSAPTRTAQMNYDIAAEEFTPVYNELKAVYENVQKMEEQLEGYGAPYTPGRLPLWE